MRGKEHRHYYVKGKIHFRPWLKYKHTRKERIAMPDGKGTGRGHGSNKRLQALRSS